MSDVSTTPVNFVATGTNFSINVTTANLLPLTNEKDFVVINTVTDTLLPLASITKDSQTQITYSGVSVGTSVNLEVRRKTPVLRYQDILYQTKLSSAVINAEFDRILRRQAEFELYGTGSANSGITNEALNQAYGSAWALDTIRPRTANVTYDKINSLETTLTGSIGTTNTNLTNSVAALNTALTLKANLSSPTLTGTPLAPTAASGTNTTQIATTAFVQALKALAKEELMPVGTIYENGSVSTNPATLLGFGTWAAFGSGRVTVAIDAGQTEFDTLGETGGTKTHVLSIAEMPTHTHVQAINTSVGSIAGGSIIGTTSSGSNTGAAGGGLVHNNLQPYIIVHRWIRTA